MTVAARWLLVAAGVALALVAPASPELLRAQVVFVLLLAVCNFGLRHAQILRRQLTLAAIAYAASAADIAIITALVAVNGGYASGLYVFYFPAILPSPLPSRLRSRWLTSRRRSCST